MSNILFINGNLHGHVHPTLPLVRELAARGENIWYFGADSFSHELEAAGAVPLKEGEELKEFYSTYRPAGRLYQSVYICTKGGKRKCP